MKVVQLHNRQLQPGGADVQLERERAALVSRGHVVERIEVDNHDVASIGNARAGAKAFWNRSVARELASMLESFDPDVVHVHTPFPIMSPAVFRVASARGCATVGTVQSWRYNCIKGTLERDGAICEECVGRRVKVPAVRHRCYQDSTAASLVLAGSLTAHGLVGTFRNHVDRFLALTPFMRERLIAEGLAPEQVVVKPNSSPDPGPPLATRRGYVLFCGRLVRDKGVRTVLEAWRRLEGEVPLVIAGEGPLRDDVVDAARDDPRIDYVGWLDRDAMSITLREADVVLLPSEWYEGLPVILTEAFAAGTPIIASDVGNFSELVVDGENGRHFAVGDPSSLARAVRAFFDDEASSSMRGGARATFDAHFREDRVMDTLEAVYRDAVASRQSRPSRPSRRGAP